MDSVGQVFVPIKLANLADGGKGVSCTALVDTGSTLLTLPREWLGKFGDLEVTDTTSVFVADNRRVEGLVTVPIQIEMEGFKRFFTQPIFIDMVDHPGAGLALLGCVPLEMARALIDPISKRLIPLDYYLAK